MASTTSLGFPIINPLTETEILESAYKSALTGSGTGFSVLANNQIDIRGIKHSHTTADWGNAYSQEIIRSGELAIDTTTGSIKINNTANNAYWSALDEFESGLPTTLESEEFYITTSSSLSTDVPATSVTVPFLLQSGSAVVNYFTYTVASNAITVGALSKYDFSFFASGLNTSCSYTITCQWFKGTSPYDSSTDTLISLGTISFTPTATTAYIDVPMIINKLISNIEIAVGETVILSLSIARASGSVNHTVNLTSTSSLPSGLYRNYGSLGANQVFSLYNGTLMQQDNVNANKMDIGQTIDGGSF